MILESEHLASCEATFLERHTGLFQLLLLKTGTAAQAQDELCRLAERYTRLAERTSAALAKQPLVAFSWIRDRKV